MPHGAFSSAKLQSGGRAAVTGPFSLNPGDPQKPALVAFYLVQGSTTVVEGHGSWSIGDKEWQGSCGCGSLKAGDAWGYGMAILVQDEPPGFATWTWTSPVEVTEAADTPT
jgi:hypothetical protein